MSADNWTYCPKCQEEARKKTEQLRARIEADYGKIPSDKYSELLHRLNNPPKLEETLREDYEIGIRDREFFVVYRASCYVCKFQYEHKASEEMTQ